MRILLVSDIHHFSTKDIFDGYAEAFRNLSVDFDVANILELNNYYAPEMSWGLVLCKALNKMNGFTHVLFTSGLIVPEWVLASKYNKKFGVIALDDPHASKILLDRHKYFDYWFTNEKTCENRKKGIFYLPTATSSVIPTMPKNEVPPELQSNVAFVGTMYDDRIKPMEDACRYCEEKNLKIKILGPLLKTPANSIIRKYAQEGIIPNSTTKLIYRGADVTINIDRNIHWNPMTSEGNPWLVSDKEPYSTNNRTYEIAACRTTQLFINPRQEIKDIFGDNVFYSGYDNVGEVLDKIFATPKEAAMKMVNNCYNTVVNAHTYTHRAKQLINYMDMADKKLAK